MSAVAGIVLVAGLASITPLSDHAEDAAAPETVSTQAGQRRMIALAAGTRIDMAPGTKLVIDRANRRVRVADGQATFIVRHDPDRPIMVDVGSATVTDIGTTFDVAKRGPRSVIGVAEGEVEVATGGRPVMLVAGREIAIAGDAAVVRPIDPASVGGWRAGSYSYRDATVGDVLADISRVSGDRVSASAAVRRLPFAGSIKIERDTARTMARLAPPLGLHAIEVDGAWQLRAFSASGGR